MTKHVPTINEYDWTLGPRWRWDCSCGDGSGGYFDREGADGGFEAHLRWKRVWADHEARMEA